MTFAPPPRDEGDCGTGSPYFTPPVVHPVSGEAVPVATLVHHYEGRQVMVIDAQTIAHGLLFCLAFGMMYLVVFQRLAVSENYFGGPPC